MRENRRVRHGADVQDHRAQTGNPKPLALINCCVNNDNGKMRCEDQTFLNTVNVGPNSAYFSASIAGVCDKCTAGEGTSGDPNFCKSSTYDYDTNFPNSRCK